MFILLKKMKTHLLDFYKKVKNNKEQQNISHLNCCKFKNLIFIYCYLSL